jgi:hypothetical protein
MCELIFCNLKIEAIHFSEPSVNGITLHKKAILIYIFSIQVRFKVIAMYAAAWASYWGGGGGAKVLVLFQTFCQTCSACMLHMYCQFKITRH